MKVRPVSCEEYESCLSGSGVPVYAGSITQKGYGLGGVLRGIASAILPLLPKIGKVFLKTAGTTALGVAADKLRGVPLSKSIKQRGVIESKKLLNNFVRSQSVKRRIPHKYTGLRRKSVKRKGDVFGAA